MQRLNQHVLFLALSKQFNCLLVRADDHIGENFLALAFGSNLVVVDVLDAIASLANLFLFQLLHFDTELEVELATSLERFLSVVCIAFDILKQLVRGVFVRVEYILDHLKAENFFVEGRFVAQELLLFGRNLACDAGCARPLLLAGQFPVFEGLNSSLKLSLFSSCVVGCLLIEGGLRVNNERQKLRSELILSCRVQAIANVNHAFPLRDAH